MVFCAVFAPNPSTIQRNRLYREALALEARMLINYPVDEIVMYDDKTEIIFHKSIRNNPAESWGVSLIKGERRFSMTRPGSHEMGHTEDSEARERHLKVSISLTVKMGKKEEPKTNTGLAMCSF